MVTELDKKTGKVTFATFDTRVNGDGEGHVMIGKLLPATLYRFKLEIRKYTLRDYTDYSNSRQKLTK
jgi:hypothetical protein